MFFEVVQRGGWNAVRRNFQRIESTLFGPVSTPTFGGLTLTGTLTLSALTASRLVVTDASKELVSSDLVSWVAGTANQITVADDSDGSITLSTPQDIHTGASNFTVAGLTVGDTLNYLKVDAEGNTRFVGHSGLPFGAIHGMEIEWTQASAVQNTWYAVSDVNLHATQLHDVTHNGSGQMTVLYDGVYTVDWSGSFEASAANKHIEITVSVNGLENESSMNHFETVAASRESPCAGNTILYLNANDTINLSMKTSDTGTPDLSVDHLMIKIVQVAGKPLPLTGNPIGLLLALTFTS